MFGFRGFPSFRGSFDMSCSSSPKEDSASAALRLDHELVPALSLLSTSVSVCLWGWICVVCGRKVWCRETQWCVNKWIVRHTHSSFIYQFSDEFPHQMELLQGSITALQRTGELWLALLNEVVQLGILSLK